jgi:uncharacterized alkaline shock family protein YloU
MKTNYNSEYGEIKITKNVIFKIVESACKKVKGIQSLGWQCYGKWGKFLNFFGFTGIKADLTKHRRITVPITIPKEENAINIAHETQREIIAAMMDNLNIDSLKVDIKIKKIEHLSPYQAER